MLMFLVFILFSQVCAGTAFFYYCRRDWKRKLQVLELEQSKFKKDLRILSAGLVKIGQSITGLEDYMHRLSARQDQGEVKQSSISTYAHAAKIVAIGGSVNDIVEGCGLTHAEAELVVALHQKAPILD